jgi:transcriptional regulator with XRE-family HTH domain
MTDLPLTRARSVRLALGLSQPDFATRIGVSQSTVSRLEQGQPETGPQRKLLDLLEREIAASDQQTEPAAQEA